jgi:hypothetical protein
VSVVDSSKSKGSALTSSQGCLRLLRARRHHYTRVAPECRLLSSCMRAQTLRLAC